VEDGLLKLDSYKDVPHEIHEQLYAKERCKRREKEQKGSGNPSAESAGHAININFLQSQSPQASSTSPADSSRPSLDAIDSITFPDLPLDVAVRKYADWHQSRVISQMMKDHIEKAYELALANGLDLKQINNDRNAGFFNKRGVIEGVARRFVDDIREWA
jgi:hypothetical protein